MMIVERVWVHRADTPHLRYGVTQCDPKKSGIRSSVAIGDVSVLFSLMAGTDVLGFVLLVVENVFRL